MQVTDDFGGNNKKIMIKKCFDDLSYKLPTILFSVEIYYALWREHLRCYNEIDKQKMIASNNFYILEDGIILACLNVWRKKMLF